MEIYQQKNYIMGGFQSSCCSIEAMKTSKQNQIQATQNDVINQQANKQILSTKVKTTIKENSCKNQEAIQMQKISSKIHNNIDIIDKKIGFLYADQQQNAPISCSYSLKQNYSKTEEKENSYAKTCPKIKNYISLKKYTPRNHYKFAKILHNENNYRVYEAVGINNSQHRAIKAQKIKQKTKKRYKYKSQCQIYMQEDIDHPNVVRLYQVYQHQGSEYLVMELMQGGSLAQMPSCRKFALRHKQNCGQSYFQGLKLIIQQILYALSYLHDKGIAHLNITPKNVLLTHLFQSEQKSSAKLTAFNYSLSKISNNLIELPKDFPLEQFQNYFKIPQVSTSKQICLKTDMWMLGISLFEVIIGQQKKKQLITKNIDYKELRNLIKIEWKKLQKQLQVFQSHCLDLILSMVQIDATKRLSPIQCLQHPWFVPLDLQQSNQNLKKKSRRALQLSILPKKSNNLLNYIENAIVYKNLNQKQMQIIAQIFTKLDKDKNGSVQIQQLIQYFSNYCNEGQDTGMFDFGLELLNNLDTDASGTITYHQFSKAIINNQKIITKQAIQDVFTHIDTDGNGKIVLSQLKNSMEGCDLSELEFYMKQIDSNFDGILTKNQFINYCLLKFQEKWKYTTVNSNQFI